MFSNSQNVVVTGGTFTMQGEFHTHTHHTGASEGREGLRLLQQKISPGAFHNSEERYDPPKCHPRTRQAVLKKIMEWIRTSSAGFMWLYGPAGSGKSAIAQTIAEMCYEDGLLAAAFFFSRTAPGRSNKDSLVATLVYQVTLCIPEIREEVGKILEHNPVLLSMSLKAQIDSLLVTPLNKALSLSAGEQSQKVLRSRPRFIIVDGLDECANEDSQTNILQVLSSAAERLSLPLIFLIASRPEQHIRDAFNDDPLASLATTVALDDTYQPDVDIGIFLQSKFDDIRRKHPSRARLPAVWPSPAEMRLLVEKSSGQFIYAATVMKYLESRRHLPTERLKIIFGMSAPGNDTPFAELDSLYRHIFSSVGDIDKVIELFVILLLAPMNTVHRIIAEIEDFLFYSPGELDLILSDLHSILSVPAFDDPKGEIRISHASLSDFLQDRSRSGKFFIDAGVGHARITALIIRHMARDDLNKAQQVKLNYSFQNHGQNAHSTPELVDALYCFDLGDYFNRLSKQVTPVRSNMPKVWWSKVPLENRWPNVPAIFFWLIKHHHYDPEKDLMEHYLRGFDKWLHTQLALYPTEVGTTYLLTAVALEGFQQFYSSIFHIINNGTNWDPDDVSTMRKIDPIHFFDIYYDSAHSTYYYGVISDFLNTPGRAGVYHIGGDQYAAFAKFLLEYIAAQDLTDKTVSRSHISAALHFLPLAFAKASKMDQLALHLNECSLECLDKEHPLYTELNKAGDAVSTYSRELSQDRNSVQVAAV